MQYQVLARKWRPKNFGELVGQEHVSRTLLNALQSGRVAHAFLFSGPRGSGKTSTARILAKALNCRAPRPGEPCGQCVACNEIASGNCMDVLEIDAASNRGIDEIRELREKVRYNPARDKNKIFIIDEVHMLTAEAFNALLKTLEEPPPNVVFILATTEYHKIPATILSRCQQYSFKLIPFPLILDRLEQIARGENIHISTSALEQIAFGSGGSLRDAMSVFDQVIAFSGETVRDEDVTMLLGLVEPTVLRETMGAIARGETGKILQVVADLAETGQDFQNFCRRLLGQLRNLMVLKAGVSNAAILGVPESLIPELRAQADLFSREDLLRLFEGLLKLETDLKHGTQIRFQLEMGLIELAHIARLRSLEDLIADFTRLVQGDGSGEAASPSLPGDPPPGPESAGRTAESAAPLKQGRNPALTLARENAPRPEPPAVEVPEKPAPGETLQSARELLLKIAASVRKESLESFLQALQGAKLEGSAVVLDPGSVNEFYRAQVRQNLGLITEAASRVVGRPVRVALGPMISLANASTEGPLDSTSQDSVLERAKREPVVQSFLEVFPGPIKAEKLD